MVAVVVLLPLGIHCNLHKLEILIQSPTSVLLQAFSHVRLGGSSDCLDGQDGEYTYYPDLGPAVFVCTIYLLLCLL